MRFTSRVKLAQAGNYTLTTNISSCECYYGTLQRPLSIDRTINSEKTGWKGHKQKREAGEGWRKGEEKGKTN